MAAKAQFRFWSFFFSTQGRVSRVPFAKFIVPTFGLPMVVGYLVIPWLRSQNTSAVNWALISALNGLLAIVLLWPQFAVIVKRLHDAGRTWLIALPFLLPLVAAIALGIAAYMDASSNFQTQYSRWVGFRWITLGLSWYTYILILVLLFLPGTKGSNSYGPDPRNPQTVSDVF